MAAYIALLRAVNVGGTGKLPMSDLKGLCEKAGFGKVRTYIASGNVVFESQESESQVKAALEDALAAYAGKPVGVLVRTAAEMAEVLAGNPFPGRPAEPDRGHLPGRTTARRYPGADFGRGRRGGPARTARDLRQLWPEYGPFQAEDPDARAGTARNINTVARLAGMAAEL